MTDYNTDDNRFGDKAYRDADVLSELYWGEELTLSEVGDVLGVCLRTVANWMEKHDIPRRGTNDKAREDAPELNNPELLREAVHREGSQGALAEKHGVCRETVRKRCVKFGIVSPGKHREAMDSECDYCGEPISVPPWKMESSDNQFCDKECSARWKRENWNGEDHPTWEEDGGLTNYGPGWREARRDARQRDGNTCQVCGTEPEGRNLDVHHIRPVRTFDDPEDAHELDNLVTMCRSCHFKWEGIPLRPDTEL